VAWLWWALIGFGCLVAGPIPAPVAVTGLLRDPRRAPWLAGALVAVVSSLAAVNFQEWLPGGDEPHYLIITQSVMRDGDLQIENNHKNGDYLAYYLSELLRLPEARHQPADSLIHAPDSALVIPAFALVATRCRGLIRAERLGRAGLVTGTLVHGRLLRGLGRMAVGDIDHACRPQIMIFPTVSGVCVMAGLLP
jgi:hypothetical protein